MREVMKNIFLTLVAYVLDVIVWGRGHSYDYEVFLKTIRKKDLNKFYSFYKCKDIDLIGNKREMFEQIEKCFNSKS